MNASCSAHKALIPKIGPDHPEPQKNAYQSSGMGGLHRASIGNSTRDGMTEAEQVEHLRRAHAEIGEDFDEQRVLDCYACIQREVDRVFGSEGNR